ncbi:MAG TPA: hypothetical protein VM680_19225 [Verrucomicrobiae bacterium]|nr:hypothetical protein [Verrucomicrobiae bacterium]
MILILSIFIVALSIWNADAQALPSFDFTNATAVSEWIAVHEVTLKAGPEGLGATITGSDPYFHGPARDYPPDQPLWLNIRIKSERGGNAQIFFFERGATEDKSVHFFVPANGWKDLRVPFPPLGSNTRFRIDPPGTSGECVIVRMSFEPRPIPVAPQWPKPVRPALGKDALEIKEGDLTLIHGRAFGAFELRVGEQSVAIGNTRSLLGYTVGASNRWVELTNATKVTKSRGALTATQSFQDPEGAKWQLTQKFSSAKDAIDVETTVVVDADRAVVWLPTFTLLAGAGSSGTNKTQGLFAGLEFLENEPSSSHADIMGPGSRRTVPDSLKISFPLMAIAADGAYVGLIWEQNANTSALFDSPDRVFNSGGHAMGILFPGSDPALREDGSLLPFGGVILRAKEKLVARATIIGGRGATTIPAAQQYVKRRGLPTLPKTDYTADQFLTLEAHGWLDSKIRDGAKFRHAVGNNFGSAAVADAPMWMDWLATKISDRDLNARLTNSAREALALVEAANYNGAAVGHIRHPVEALVYGAVEENVASAVAQGRSHLGAFTADGSIQYHVPAKGLDLGKTHSSREANGLAATHVTAILDRAAFSGDRELIKEAVRLLHGLDKFRDTVPRGAQTWEVPLHTPDILGSAYLVRAYLIGYELTGERDFLEQAKYWAWTGVPFTYLTSPTPGPVGVYSTTPVFGATQFVAPNWIGLPVQWCGLVYGDAIRRLARFDKAGPWLQLANGIAAAGVQHTHTAVEPDFQGLLPDSFDLRAQNRNPVPINPATLLPEAIQFYDFPAIYDFRTFLNRRLRVHCPGPITNVREKGDSVRFRAEGWPKRPWRFLVNGFDKRPTVKVEGREVDFQMRDGRVILQLEKPSTIEVLL